MLLILNNVDLKFVHFTVQKDGDADLRSELE